MDEEFLNDFVGLKTGGTTASVLKKTRSGESLPRVKTAASSSPGRDGDSRSAAASNRSRSVTCAGPSRRLARQARGRRS